jgi:hypothetical protein
MSGGASDEDLYRALVEGEVEASAPAVRALFARRPELELEWHETLTVLGALAQASQRRSEVLAQAARIADADAGGRAEAKLRELAGSRAGVPGSAPSATFDRRKRRSWPVWTLLLAAAALVFLMLRPLVPTADDGSDSIHLGDEEFQLLPSPSERSSLRFAWKGDLPPGARVHLFVEGRANRADKWARLPELSPRDLGQSPWSPDPESAASWPRYVRWKLRVMDGRPYKATAWSELELSP